MPSYDDLVEHWGRQNLIHLPIDELPDVICGPEALPPDGALPIEVPLLFTAVVDRPDLRLFSMLNVVAENDHGFRLVVIGAAPEEPDLLFCLDPADGSVGLLQLSTGGIEYVNGSLRLFVEFLYEISRLVGAGHRGEQRVDTARRLRTVLEQRDPAAFSDAETWWSVAFDHGLAAR
jgi:SUKH-4 immunity protein